MIINEYISKLLWLCEYIDQYIGVYKHDYISFQCLCVVVWVTILWHCHLDNPVIDLDRCCAWDYPCSLTPIYAKYIKPVWPVDDTWRPDSFKHSSDHRSTAWRPDNTKHYPKPNDTPSNWSYSVNKTKKGRECLEKAVTKSVWKLPICNYNWIPL